MNIDETVLKEQNNLIVGDNGEIYVKPTESGWITYPIEDLSNSIALTPEEYVLLKAGYFKINKDKNGVELNVVEDEEENVATTSSRFPKRSTANSTTTNSTCDSKEEQIWI